MTKLKYLSYVFCIIFLLNGCSYADSLAKKELNDTWAESGFITLGHTLTIQNTDNYLTLLDHMDTLASDGLYYASWAGKEKDTNSDTVDQYDVQLYFLLGEYSDRTIAESNLDQWIATGKVNYDILSEKEITCNDQLYSLIIYNCSNQEKPYDRGILASGIYQNTALCIELTCQKDFEDDLENILINFLNNCTYSTDSTH